MPGVNDILNAAKVTLEAITDSASAALSYINTWNVAGGNDNPIGRFFRFVNDWVRNVPGSTRQDATQEYHTAGYWANQGKYLSMLDPDVPIPRALARDIYRTIDDTSSTQNYRYQVSATITWKDTGYQGTFNTYVYSDIPLTQSGAMQQALDQIKEHFKSRSKPTDDQSDEDYWWVTTKVNEFVQINAR
jgi:hypothetical protein